jgi:hypothetical protein
MVAHSADSAVAMVLANMVVTEAHSVPAHSVLAHSAVCHHMVVVMVVAMALAMALVSAAHMVVAVVDSSKSLLFRHYNKNHSSSNT